MDTNMTFRIDSQVKAQMAAICEQLGISTPVLHDVGHWKPLPSMSGIPCSA